MHNSCGLRQELHLMREVAVQPKVDPLHPITRAYVLIGPAMEKMEASIQKEVSTTVELIPEVAEHLIGAGGKRIRPTVLMLMANAVGARLEQGIELAVATELIHNATLLHDDVVDRGQLRRGVPAAPVVYGNSATVLVGDFLMARAFDLVVRHGNLDLLHALTQVVTSMAEGEVLQLIRSGRITLSLPTYQEIISGKTAGLFSWCCRAGASLGPRHNGKQLQAAADFGKSFGMAFQLTDDILDYTASPEQSGKDLANDLREGKATLPLLLACEEDQDLFKTVEKVAKQEPTAQECLKIVERVLKTSSIDRSLNKAKEYARAAQGQLDSFTPGKASDILHELCDYIVERVN